MLDSEQDGGIDMLKVLNCVAYRHDTRLVAVSALICVLGCYTTATLLARAHDGDRRRARQWLIGAAGVFGCSVWSLHFVAMLAFMPSQQMAYRTDLTVLSAIVASAGAIAAFAAWTARIPAWARTTLGGLLLGSAVSGMHYIGIAAMSFSGMLFFDRGYVAASLAICAVFSAVALARASASNARGSHIEVAGWLALAICGLHFTGMTAITIAPGVIDMADGAVLGSATLAAAVGSISVAILISSLAAITVEQHLSRRALQELSRMRLMSDLAQEVLFIHRDGVLVEMNSAGERLFGAPTSHLRGRPVLSLFAVGCVPALMRRASCPPSGRPPEEVEIRAVGGASIAVEISCQPIQYLGKPATVVVLRDLTARKRDEARIRHLARHDALTDLPNRYSLQERLDLALDVAEQQRSTLAVIYIDLDRFKSVNDLHGHAAGDALLIQVSQRVSAEIQPLDMLARIGGDEFVMMLTSQPQPEKVVSVTSRVLEALRRPFEIEGKRIEIGASIGVALYPQDGASADILMRAADAALYRVKEDGRGAVRFYEPSMNAQVQARLQLEQELAGAIEHGELVLHYQPIVNGIMGAVESFEALVRWMHPTRGMVAPADFIPLAEETDLIDHIGRWVIQEACREAASWPVPCRVSVNVSPKQFRRSDVCGTIATALQTNALDPARFVVEVTEGVLINDAEKAVATLNRLREMGVRIALDDFGTGYSSLSYLQLFRFDEFKIDKSFIRRLGENENALTLTRTIVNLGHNLGLHVTAEGVETAGQLAILRSLGCDQIQGYLVAKAAPMGAFTDLDRLRVMGHFAPSRALLSA